MDKNKINWMKYGAFALALLVSSCWSNKKERVMPAFPPATKKQVSIPRFDDSLAYSYVAKQVSFGPRVPGSPGHKACKAWIIEYAKSLGLEVREQNFEAKTYYKQNLPATNIIISINPTHKRRVLLGAHWDTRHISDKDPDPNNKKKPLLGADDGGSGVGVLLSLAKTLKENPIDLGVDIILFDAEDLGEDGGQNELSWCLGSQYWAENLHVEDYWAMYGILLDLVGAPNPRFSREGYSMNFAPELTNKIWTLARSMNLGNSFVAAEIGGITDDHVYVNKIAKIPMVDIINVPGLENQFFPAHHHTQKDDMTAIDKNSLRIVGQLVTAIIYQESGGMF